LEDLERLSSQVTGLSDLIRDAKLLGIARGREMRGLGFKEGGVGEDLPLQPDRGKGLDYLANGTILSETTAAWSDRSTGSL
jgi:hypothetical protein